MPEAVAAQDARTMMIERGCSQHLGSRNEQQDAVLMRASEERSEQMIVVADGMGGHAGGRIASGEVVKTAERVWNEHLKAPLEPKRLLERIVREGHEAINRAGSEKGVTPRSTCAILFVRKGNVHWAHVGDSRVYRLREGQLERLTRDHSVVQMLVDLGKLSEEEMGNHPDQNRLTQSLGGDTPPVPDFGADAIKPRDAFLVCSDGLWEMIPQAEMAAALAVKKLGDDGARQLAERAYDRAKPRSDNITVALLRLGGQPEIAPADPSEAATVRLGETRSRSAAPAFWGVIAATVVALGAAAAIVYKPWERPAAQPEPAAKSPRGDDAGAPRRDEPKQGEPKQGEPKQGEPKQGEPKQGEPKPDAAPPEPKDRAAPSPTDRGLPAQGNEGREKSPGTRPPPADTKKAEPAPGRPSSGGDAPPAQTDKPGSPPPGRGPQ